MVQKGWHVILFGLLTFCSALFCIGQTRSAGPHYVVAHWIIPMSYYDGEPNSEIFKDDVRTAREEGIDGFAVDAFNGPEAESRLAAFIKAADAVGATNFKVFLSADMSKNFPASDIVRVMTEFGRNPHYLQFNNKPLLSTYRGERLGNDWWQQGVIEPLRRTGMAVTFIPNFERDDPNRVDPSVDNWKNVIRKYPSAEGLFNFHFAASAPFYSGDPNLGNHYWSAVEGAESLSTALHNSNKFFIGEYMPYYWAVCHPVRQYLEFQGGRGMDNTWQSILRVQHPEMVEIVTWNDYSESTYLEPSKKPQTHTPGIESFSHVGYYELLKYYIQWYHTGIAPNITKDALFFFYRTRPLSSIPNHDSACQLGPTNPKQIWGNPKDVIYITTALTAPAEVRVSSGNTSHTVRVPAGLSSTEIDFAPGKQMLELWRNGKRLAQFEGEPIVVDKTTEDLNVYSGYTIVGGGNSHDWTPSDAFKSGYVASWFSR